MIDGMIKRQAAMIGYINDFWPLGVACFATLPLIMLIRPVERRAMRRLLTWGTRGLPHPSRRWTGAFADQPFLRCRRPSSSAICTAFSAAPLRRLSDTHHSARPFSTVESSRTRLM